MAQRPPFGRKSAYCHVHAACGTDRITDPCSVHHGSPFLSATGRLVHRALSPARGASPTIDLRRAASSGCAQTFLHRGLGWPTGRLAPSQRPSQKELGATVSYHWDGIVFHHTGHGNPASHRRGTRVSAWSCDFIDLGLLGLGITFLAITLPACAAAVHAVGTLLDRERLAVRPERMAEILDTVARRAEQADTIEELRNEFALAEEITAAESQEWLASLSFRELELPV